MRQIETKEPEYRAGKGKNTRLEQDKRKTELMEAEGMHSGKTTKQKTNGLK